MVDTTARNRGNALRDSILSNNSSGNNTVTATNTNTGTHTGTGSGSGMGGGSGRERERDSTGSSSSRSRLSHTLHNSESISSFGDKIWGLRVVDMRLLMTIGIRDTVFGYVGRCFDFFQYDVVVSYIIF